jgi:hypothetical protein
MLAETPVHVGLVEIIICEGSVELGFQYGNYITIYPVESRVFFGTKVTLRITFVSPIKSLLGVSDAEVIVSG